MRRYEWTDLTLASAISAATNFIYFALASNDYFFPDSFTYLAPARNLLHGLGFTTANGIETLRTPGYPLLLAAFGLRIVPMIAFQHLLNVALSVAIYLFVMQRLGSRFIAIGAAILFAIDTPTLHYANKILTETLFTALLFAVFVLVVYARKLPLAGVLTGALVLIRPVAIAYFVVAAVCLALRRVPVRTIAIYVALALVFPVGWGLRNLHHTGVFTISSIGGINLLTYRAAGALAIEDDGDFDADLADEMQGLRDTADDEIQVRLRIPDAQELPVAIRSKYYSQTAWRVIRQHPRAATMLTLRGLLVNLFDSRWEGLEIVSSVPTDIVRRGLDAFTAALFVFAAAGAIALWKRDCDLALLTIATIAYFLLISAGGEAEARFRVPVMPMYVIAASCALGARASRPHPRGTAGGTPGGTPAVPGATAGTRSST